MDILKEIGSAIAKGKTVDGILDYIHDSTKEKFGSCELKTFSVFVDKGKPTFFYTRENKELLRNLFVPWKSVAGECMKNNQIVIMDKEDPRHYGEPAKKTGVEFNYIAAIPVSWKGKVFSCMEFLTYNNPKKEEIELFKNFSYTIAPIIACSELENMISRGMHDFKNKAWMIMLNLDREVENDPEKIIEKVRGYTNQILDLSQEGLQLGCTKLNLTKNNLNYMIDDIENKTRELAKLYNKPVRIEKKQEYLPEILCDKETMKEEVLFNLVKNTWEAFEEKNQTERIFRFKTYREKETAVMEVGDNAGGIPKDIQDNLFSAYTSGKGFGRGVGLRVCYQIVRANNGMIEFNSEEGKGTNFYIKLPIN